MAVGHIAIKTFLAFFAAERRQDITCQQLFLRQQTGILERVNVGQITQRLAAEARQEFLGSSRGVRRARLWVTRARGDEVLGTQRPASECANYLANAGYASVKN